MRKYYFLLFLLIETHGIHARINERQMESCLAQAISVTSTKNKTFTGELVNNDDGSISLRIRLDGGFTEQRFTPSDVSHIALPEEALLTNDSEPQSLSISERIFHARRNIFSFLKPEQNRLYIRMLPHSADSFSEKRKLSACLNIIEAKLPENDLKREIIERQTILFYELGLLDEAEKYAFKFKTIHSDDIASSSFPQWIEAQIAVDRNNHQALNICLKGLLKAEPQARPWQDKLYMLAITKLIQAKEQHSAEALYEEMQRRSLAWDKSYLPFPFNLNDS